MALYFFIMQYIFTYIFFLAYTFCISQNNLVINHSFEDFNNSINCINSGDAIYKGYCPYWHSPDNKTPDRFSECPPWGGGVPSNSFGFEYVQDGTAYAGLGLFDKNNDSGLREFVQGTLAYLLQKDTTYCISFWMSHGDSTNYYINVKNIGIWFLNDSLNIPALYDSLANIQQKVSFIEEDFYLENDSGWVELKIEYKARGGEKYFIIGNFALSDEVDTLYKSNTKYGFPGPRNFAYYYLDEVSIYRCNDTLPPPVPKDTTYLNLPTAFSPNGDGQNDVFSVLGTKYVQRIELRVYNRWGQQVFYTNEKEQGWDGTFKGQPAPTGVYAYTLVATLPNEEVITKKGNVTLKR